MKRIVVGVDGSECSGRAVDAAAKLSAETGAELTLVTTSTLPAVIDEEGEAYANAEHVLKKDVRNLLYDPRPLFLHHARDRATAAGARGVETLARIGDPAEEIVDTAKRRHADLIVVGRRGRGRLAALLCGSVSQKTMQLAPCPVMIIP